MGSGVKFDFKFRESCLTAGSVLFLQQGATVQNNPFLSSSAIQIGSTNQTNHSQAGGSQPVSLLNASYDGNTVAISSLPTAVSGQFQIQPVTMVQSQPQSNTGEHATVSNQQNNGKNESLEMYPLWCRSLVVTVRLASLKGL